MTSIRTPAEHPDALDAFTEVIQAGRRTQARARAWGEQRGHGVGGGPGNGKKEAWSDWVLDTSGEAVLCCEDFGDGPLPTQG